MKRIRFSRNRHRLVADLVLKAKLAGSAVLYMAGVVKVAEAAMVLWDRVIG